MGDKKRNRLRFRLPKKKGIAGMDLGEHGEETVNEGRIQAADPSPVIPDSYHYFGEFLLGDVTFKSFRVAVDAAIHLTDLFAEMHREGRNGRMFSPEDLWIETETGRVIWNKGLSEDICNTEENRSSLLMFSAPEIILKKVDPNIYTDRYLLGILIFQFIMGGHHPLEGRKSVGPVMTREMRETLYVRDPRFIFDEQANDNQPVLKLHMESIKAWASMPEFVKDLFRRCFASKNRENIKGRPSEQEWKDALIRYQNVCISCTCGSILLYQGDREYKCPKCGRPSKIDYQIDLPETSIPAIRGNRVYSNQVDRSEDEATDIYAKIVASQKDIHKLGIQNMMDISWTATTTKGQQKDVEPSGIIPIKDGIQFQIHTTNIIIKEIRKQ